MWTIDSVEWKSAKLQLERAFRAADSFVWSKRSGDPLNGFGRGETWGEEVLTRFMPVWFESWFRHERWLSTFLLQGEAGWSTTVSAFGYAEGKWDELMMIFIPAHLAHYSRSLEQCEKPEVAAYHARR